VNEIREIENETETLRKIEIERLTREDKEHDNACREKTLDDRQWQRRGDDNHSGEMR